jgi:anti-anti-sigma regulatory factor
MGSAGYERSGNTLRITGALDQPVDVRFDIEVRALIEAASRGECPSVIIDFRGVTSFGSQYLAALETIAEKLKGCNSALTLCVDKAMANLMRSFGVDKVARLESH